MDDDPQSSEEQPQRAALRRSKRHKDPLEVWTKNRWSMLEALQLGILTEEYLTNFYRKKRMSEKANKKPIIGNKKISTVKPHRKGSKRKTTDIHKPIKKSKTLSRKQVKNKKQTHKSLTKSITITEDKRDTADRCSIQTTDCNSYNSKLVKESTDFSKIEKSDDGYITPGSSSLSLSYDLLNERSLEERSDFAGFEDDKQREKLAEKREFANTRKVGDINDHSMRLVNFTEYISSSSFSNSENIELIENNLSTKCDNPWSPVIKNEERNERKIALSHNLDSVNYTSDSRSFLNNNEPSWFKDRTLNYSELPHEYRNDEKDDGKSRNDPEEYNDLIFLANDPSCTSPATDSLNSPLTISLISSELDERNNNENHQMTFNLTSMKPELENAMCSGESTDKAGLLKSLNWCADLEEMHKMPLAWRIPARAQYSSDNKENLFGKTNGGNERKRLTRSSAVLSERNSLSRLRPRTFGTPKTSNSENIDDPESDEKREAERHVIKNRRQPYAKLTIVEGKKRGQSEGSVGLQKEFKGAEKSDESQYSKPRKRRTTITGTGDEYILKRESRVDSDDGMNISGESQDSHDVRRVTRSLTKTNKENFIGKLVWGACSGWWPALIIDADHVGMIPKPGKLWVYWIGEAHISHINEKTQIEPFLHNLEARLKITSNLARNRALEATMQLLRPRFDCNLMKPYYNWIRNNIAKLNQSLDDMKFYPYPIGIERILNDLKAQNAKTTEEYLKKMENDKKKGKNNSSVAKKPKDIKTQKTNAGAESLPLKDQKPGAVAWAKIAGHSWWPAMIIDYRDCCMREPGIGYQWIMWYGDYQLSQVHHQSYLEFGKGFHKMIPYIQKTKNNNYLTGVLQAAKDYCSRLCCSTEDWTLSSVIEYFEKNPFTDVEIKIERKEPIKMSDVYTPHILKKLSDAKNNLNLHDDRQDDLENSDELLAVKSGKASLNQLCLKCLKMFDDEMEDHPFFLASLCKECSAQFKPCMFLYGNDGKCFHCAICGGSGTVIVCDNEDCPRVYCRACIKHLFCPTTYEVVMESDPWECFLCKPDGPMFPNFTIKPRLNWKDRQIDMFRTRSNSTGELIKNFESKKRMRVLSLFDGLSTGLLVLQKLGFEIEVFYASEIDKDALMVSNTHFGDQITHLGDVREITKEKINEIAPIDFLMGGSPCNDLSMANPARRGLHDPAGTGILFFDYCRIKKLLMKANKGRHLFWLFENVASMPTEYRLEMNKHLGQEPDVIDSADFSPQHRLRLYWHNLPLKLRSLSTYGEQDVQDILTPNCQRYALVKKIRTVTTKVNSLKQGKFALKPILMEDEGDTLWITELEEIFGFPRHFTDVKNLCATKRHKLIGRAWSVQTITAMVRSLIPYFKYNRPQTI